MSTNLSSTVVMDMFSAYGYEWCTACGAYHKGICLRVKAIDYYANGAIKRVEYHDWARPELAS